MSDNSLGSSSPCQDCHRKLLSLGIKRIIYTGENNNVHKKKIQDCVPYGVSTGSRYIKNDFKYSGKKPMPKKLRQDSNSDLESETDTESESEK